MQNREVSVLRGSPVSYFNTGRQYSQTSLIRMSKVPALQRCPNYKGESCMSFVVFGTENCVRIIEVYIRRGSTVITELIQTTQSSLLSKTTITLFIKQTIQYTNHRSCRKNKENSIPQVYLRFIRLWKMVGALVRQRVSVLSLLRYGISN